MNAPLDPKKFAQVSQPLAKNYHAGDLYDAYALATSDLNWASYMLYDLKNKFDKIKQTCQERYGMHDIEFDEITTFFGMYGYLIEARHAMQSDEAERYEKEWEALKANPQNPPDASGLQADYGEW